VLFFSKMFRDLQPSMMGVTLSDYSGSLPRFGTMQNGVVYEHQMLERPTAVNDGSAWPTPQLRDWKTGSTPESGRIQRERKQGWSLNLNDAALWPTPAARDWRSGKASPETMECNSRPLNEQVTNWPTPRATMGHHTQPSANRKHETGGPPKRLEVEVGRITQGQLSADWVEMLQGYPPGWTRIED
jgi:hypothetical protein